MPEENGSPLSLDMIREFRGSVGEEAFAEVCEEYLRNSEELLGKMRAAASAGQADELRRIAHTLKGSSGAVGAAGLQGLCHEFEAFLSSGGQARACGDMLERMTGELAAVRRAFREL